MAAETQLQFSQRESQTQAQLVPGTQLLELSKTPSISSPDDSLMDSDADTDNSNLEPRRSGCVCKPTWDKASQLSQEAAMAKAKVKGKGKGRKMRKSIPTSQLLEEFGIDLQ
jgi:hypothetical protein